MSAPAAGPAARPLAQLERPPILVVGDAYTGATWVADVLDSHPQVAGLSELRLFSNVGLEPPFRDSHWNPESSERMFDRRMGFGQFLAQDRVTADLRALADGWLARALSPEHRFLVERSPIGAPGIRAFATLYPEGLVIHVLRDGRELVDSAFAQRDRLQPASEDAEPPPARWRLMWSMGNSWSSYVKALQEAAQQMPTAFHEIRYEKLAARPKRRCGSCSNSVGFRAMPRFSSRPSPRRAMHRGGSRASGVG